VQGCDVVFVQGVQRGGDLNVGRVDGAGGDVIVAGPRVVPQRVEEDPSPNDGLTFWSACRTAVLPASFAPTAMVLSGSTSNNVESLTER
jgi:hypothetical protein